jgi:hypothetical protein
LRPVIYHGWAGAAPFQKVVGRPGENMLMWAGALLPLALAIGALGLCATPFAPTAAVVPMAALLLVAGYAALVASGVDVGRSETTPRRLRALVAFLHVCQPVARVYGRLSAKPLGVRQVPRPVWTGNRIDWLKQLSQELAVRRCVASFGGSAAAYDLVASAGPFVRAELVAAVQWGWVPRLRFVVRPRPLGLVITGSILFVSAFVSLWALLAMTTLLATVVTVETWFVKRAVAGAVRVTTAGAVGEK